MELPESDRSANNGCYDVVEVAIRLSEFGGNAKFFEVVSDLFFEIFGGIFRPEWSQSAEFCSLAKFPYELFVKPFTTQIFDDVWAFKFCFLHHYQPLSSRTSLIIAQVWWNVKQKSYEKHD